MNTTGLLFLLAGIIIGTLVENWPKAVKTAVWVLLAFVGLILLGYLNLPK